MRLNVSAWAIRKPLPSVVLFLVLMILGLVSFRSLPITRFPNIDIPIVSVTITQSGAAPSELQTQVTKWVEDSVAGVKGVKHILSTITEGTSTTTIEFRLEVNQDRATNDVKDAIAKIRQNLPRTIDEPIVSRVEIAGLPIMVYGASAPAMTPEDLSWFVDDVVARGLQSVKGVGGVERLGGVAREIRVTLKPDRLLALGITAADVNRQLRLTSADMAGGRAEVGGQEQSIRALAASASLETLAKTSIVVPGNRKVRLDELATLSDTAEEPRTFARFNGEPVVAFAISRASGASDADVSVGVAKKIAALHAANPNVRFDLIDTSVVNTIGNYHSAMMGLIEGAALAVVVVLLFLRDWRATLIAAVALPLSVLPTFWVMSALGFSLNAVSLLAITLVTGILVDDAIVEIENIVRHMRMGKSPYRASLEAADEIGLAVIAITATIIAIFSPVSFMGGIAGQYFKQFGLTIAAAVFMSLLVARLITPLLAAYFLRDHGPDHERDGFVMRGYTRLVAWSVRHKFITLVLGIACFAASIASTGLLPAGFLPAEDQARTLFVVELPPGARLPDTVRVTDRIEEKIRALPEVKSVFVDGGRQLPAKKEVRLASLTINLTPKNARHKTQKQVDAEVAAILREEPDLRFWALREGGQRDLALIIAGPDKAVVAEVAAKLQREAQRVPHLVNVMSTAPLDRTEVRIRPKPAVAADLGVSTDTIAETVRVGTIGDIGMNLAKFNATDRQVPIRVQLPERLRGRLSDLETLKVPVKGGAAVPLATVADISLGQGPTGIDRYDRAVRVALEGDMQGTDALAELITQVMNLPTAKNLPPGVTISQTGDAEVMGEVFEGFALAMGAGLMMVFGVLILLFGNFLQPLTILFSLPLSIGGAILALLICHMPISMPVVIGILMLMGVVTKNAIMLVDFAVEQIRAGVDRNVAIVDAGRKRARPIVMTTIAMAAGMVPSAMAYGIGGEFRSPMAVAVIGGLIVSTVLSLVFVPAIFVLMDDLSRLLKRLFGRFVGERDDPEDATTFDPAHPANDGHPLPPRIAAE
ncbi:MULTISPECIES: efflux RND transporter permease subunit [Methylobacterium]|uniref:Efflux pump membrane transporter BepE n=5 Tax=Methylobacterium TaxID=407 RepID=A0AAE8HWY8_9HYPH|nr:MULTISPECIES: efflux RND transporter permease subunit [Methylobacterium]AIQ93564.1 Acriflavin resistance protein [Methylobacterium oryzae CBMB20]APT33835.1 efflux pump membrane transporter BepE [Methylobacterium phyllosphaerae]AWV15059.1 ABC transporter permease [Methylobacterium sp. XJLW]MBA9061041.1 hydrophobe/amphiphile efflux-1 (HAE1) family protein [Methylobacterium fujisawaense]MBP27959.1 AcrB/AcrD/AcrF family protein [Methylobacterium sp.]